MAVKLIDLQLIYGVAGAREQFEELATNGGATLVEAGTDHRLANPETLAAMLKACETKV